MELLLKYFTDFTDEQVRQFRLLEPLYREWNEKINVISRKDIDSLYEKHVLHSLSIAATFELTEGMSVLDLGTGGGFPGIPLAIFFPQVRFHLVDSIGKKLKVVEAIAEGTGLQNVTTQHTRIEDIRNRPQDPKGKFDLVVSRAVAPLKDLWRWSKPFLKIKTQPDFTPGLVCLKGGDLTAEIQECPVKPRVMDIVSIFPEESFQEKYLLYLTR